MKAYIIDRFVDETEAFIGVQDLALQRGFAVFDFFRTHQGKAVFLEEHLDRFFHSASLLHLKGLPERAAVKELVLELLELNNLQNSGLRMMFTGGYSSDGYHPGITNLIMVQKNLAPTRFDHYEKGIKIISHSYQRELPEVKSINYLIGVWLQQKMAAEAADDVVFHLDGKVSELPRANIFLVNADDEIITPAQNILQGITRSKILSLPNFSIHQKDVSLAELKNAKEVFITSTTKKVLPVRQIDEAVIGDGKPGEMSLKISEAFLDMLGE